ncbi:hypothetical protein [Streptomyces sp. NPDC051636]|uniref:hypothetical protein n=1 Tax=Streptomyces sp. NPDC051636 TaxID=3365663 RepID=UPI0037A7EC52
MSETDNAATELTTQYATQVAGDLERNLKEQERVSGEIAALQEQLAALQEDRTILLNIQQALGVTPAPRKPAAGPVAATVPPPRTKTATKASQSKRTRAKSAAPSRKPAAKKTSSRKTPDKATGSESARPTLVDVVRGHLAAQSEPRSAAEIAAALGQEHPERAIKTTVVRSTLEGLVAKNQARRTKQGSSVFYTAPEAAEPAPEGETGQAQPA